MNSLKRTAILALALLLAGGMATLPAASAPAAASVETDSPWIYENPLPTGSNLYSVSALADDDVWVSGGNGAIFSYDGSTWVDRSIPNILSSNLDICPLDATHVWMSAGARGIYFWNGSEWKLQKKGIYLPFSVTGLDVLDATHGWAVGTAGGILHWDGATWTQQASGATTAWLEEVSATAPDNAWAVGAGGTILHWDGASWSPQASGTTDNLSDVCATAPDNAWAVGEGGTILHWDGASWSPQASGSSCWLYDVDALDANHAWAVGPGGTILYWNGSAWAPQGSGTTEILSGISAVDADHAWAVGSSGTILHYESGTWSSGPRGATRENLNAVHAVDADHAWAAGANGTILFYDGSSWSAESSGTTAELRGVYARAPEEVFAVGAEGTILFYDGTGWNPQASGTTEWLYGISALDATHAWAVGAGGTILFYDGTGWNPQASGTTLTLFQVCATAADNAWAVGAEGTILHWDGTEWAPRDSGTGSDLYGLSATAADNAWAVGAEGTILHWDGSSWAHQDSGTYAILYGVSAPDPVHVWAVGEAGVILYFDGLSWSEQPCISPEPLQDVFALDAGHVWAVGDNGTIIAGAAPGPARWYLAEGCTEGGMETFVLVQNPNPFNVTVDITLQTSNGEQKPDGLQDQVIPASSRRTFPLHDYLSEWDVSTLVIPDDGQVICERAMYGEGRTWAHDSTGVTAPADEWFLAEGCTQGGMETWVLVQNPGTGDAVVDLTCQTGEGEVSPPLLQGVTIPAGSRRTFKLNDYLVSWDVSTRVMASQGQVICERAMYGEGRTWAHDSAGVTAPAGEWFLAEGCTQGGMETWVLVQNPGTGDAVVDLTCQTGEGEVSPSPLQGQVIPAGARRSFKLNDYVTGWDVSTRVSALEGAVICERAMYGEGRTWAHDSAGVTAPAGEWFLAEGCTQGGMETWVLVQNPGTGDAVVDLTCQTGEGEVSPPLLQGVTIPAGARRSFKLNDYVTGWDVSTRVSALEGAVICERAMYGEGRTWAHDSAGYSP